MSVTIKHTALIVAHGAPSSPQGHEIVLQDLAAAAEALLPPGWAVKGSTLAAPEALDVAVRDLPKTRRLFVYPLFMADGWFTTEELPRRLKGARAGDVEFLPPFGLDPAVRDLCLRRAVKAIYAEGFAIGEAGLLLAAHGSPADSRPGDATRVAVRFLIQSGMFREVCAGFIDQSPYLADAASIEHPALCLPFFASLAGHMETDVPQALGRARFTGPILAPIGTDPEVPDIIAAALERSNA